MILFKQLRTRYRREIHLVLKGVFTFFALIFIVFAIAVVLDILTRFDFIVKHIDFSDPKRAINFNAAIMLILTIVIIIGSWRQIHNANTISKNDFLLRIDRHYCGGDILRARTIIHMLYREKGGDEMSDVYKINETAKEIERIRVDKTRCKDFMCLVNFVDFLETIALNYNKGSIDKRDLDILSIDSIKFYYQIYMVFICSRRIRSNNPKYYSELEKLVAECDRR